MKRLKKIFIFGALLAAASASAARAQTPLDAIERRFPECRGIFTETQANELAEAPKDPEEAFEEWRRSRLAMIEETPFTVCGGKAWRLLHGVTSARAEEREEEDGDSLVGIFAASARIGENLAPASGVDQYQGETFIAINPNDPQQLVAGANTGFRDPDPACQAPAGAAKTFGTQALYGSKDGGKTWTYRCAPWHPAVTGGVPGADAYAGSDPALAWDAAGNAYAAYMLISQDNAVPNVGAAIVVAKSTDSGTSWQPLGVVVNNIASTTQYDDKEMIAIDTTSGGAFSHPGRIYVIWGENNVERVAWSDDGIAWTTHVFPAVSLFHLAGNVTVGPDGTVYAVWNQVFPADPQTGKAAPDRTWFSKSTDGGNSWTAPALILTHGIASVQRYYLPAAQDNRGVNGFVSIDVDRNPASLYFGDLYLAYSDTTVTCCPLDTFSQIDVYVTSSPDDGAHWSLPVRVNDDSTGTTHMLPWLAVDASDGTVHVAWYDTRNDVLNRGDVQVFYARSSNGGASFEPNLRLTDTGTKLANAVDFCNESDWTNAQRDPNQHGEYMGIAAANRKVHAFWTDSRQFFPNFTAKREDAVTATATNCSAPSWGPLSTGAPTVPASSVGPFTVSWPAVPIWGINATTGHSTLERYSGSGCTGLPVKVASSNGTSVTDAPPASGIYSYRVRARNNCPGTALTPMTSYSGCSGPVKYTKVP
ncbi:MAG TPA: sialidase family protein [Thermoanaerobaculia bacterium]|nr:sialidase family protein [Thermoanaerobaculia bacterium]